MNNKDHSLFSSGRGVDNFQDMVTYNTNKQTIYMHLYYDGIRDRPLDFCGGGGGVVHTFQN